jgi:hypothetical protein
MPMFQAGTWDERCASPRHRVDVMVCGDGSSLMTTNGVGFRTRPGFTMEENGCIEVYALVSRDGPRIARVLTALAECTHVAAEEHPFHFYDRMPFPEPMAGIAGVVLAPRFDLMALESHRVTWCAAVPITVAELDAIRRGDHSGEDLVKSIDDDERWQAISDRWAALADQ